MCGKLLLELYGMAREMPSAHFTESALGLVKSLLPPHSARWTTIKSFAEGSALVCAYQHDEPISMVLNWEQLGGLEPMLETVVRQIAQECGLPVSSPGAEQKQAGLHDGATRHKPPQAGPIVARFIPPHGHKHGISLSLPDRRLGNGDCQIVEQFMPHLVEAFTINRLIFLRPAWTDGKADRENLAIARVDGLLHFIAPGFQEQLRQKWPDWHSIRLPEPLLAELCPPPDGRMIFTSPLLSVSAKQIGDILFLRTHATSALSQLTQREQVVARLFGEGLSYKEIARSLDVAPNTVRTFLQRIYVKLKISSKTELTVLVARDLDQSRRDS